MADVNKSRQALARNLPARGFTMDGLRGTCGEFQIILGDTGWVMKKAYVQDELGLSQGGFNFWYQLLRWVSPLLLAYLFIHSLGF